MRAAADFSTVVWRKSSYTNGEGGNCVEIAEGFDGVIPVRDSKVPDGHVLVITDVRWTAFVDAVKGGSFTRP
jgi:Domain of unknown function (DUF397)